MKLIIADDQTIIRDGLVTICEQLSDVEVVATAGDGRQAPCRRSARSGTAWTTR
ncbi:hypothetical protein [Streptomyces sp. NPDC001139]